MQKNGSALAGFRHFQFSNLLLAFTEYHSNLNDKLNDNGTQKDPAEDIHILTGKFLLSLATPLSLWIGSLLHTTMPMNEEHLTMVFNMSFTVIIVRSIKSMAFSCKKIYSELTREQRGDGRCRHSFWRAVFVSTWSHALPGSKMLRGVNSLNDDHFS